MTERRKDGMTERWKDGMTERQKDRQGKSSIAPTFSKRGYNYLLRKVSNKLLVGLKLVLRHHLRSQFQNDVFSVIDYT